MAHLRVCVLGSFQVQVADLPVTSLESDKARALLAYLAVESDRPHRREVLAGLLWPDSPEDLARGNLRHALHALRQAIGDPAADPPYLLIGREDIQFNTASDYALDVALFEARLAACDRHCHAHLETCSACAENLRQAVVLYRGKFLEQFFVKDSAEFEEWALVHRESLHRRALEALARLAEYHAQRGEFEQAQDYARRQLELDLWREEAHRQLMRVLAASGQRSAALAQYETCRRVLAQELGVEPSAETRELAGQIGRGDGRAEQYAPAPASARMRSPLPVPLTPFVGRERELAELTDLLDDASCRLVTLVGPGGSGKTRLALEAAARNRAAFRDGAAFVPLAPISASAAILPAMAGALDFAFYGSGDPLAQLLRFLGDKHLLVVVDNVEHLLDAAGLWVEILQHAPEVKLLVTSREALNLQDEWVFEVEGLPMPESDRVEDLEAYAATALFLQRARRARVGFALRPQDRPAVARLCRLVDGMPLAIELAATWVRTLSCPEIVHEVECSLDFLAAPVRDLEERHRSMRAVFEPSWRMLTPEEQRVLRRLSVFRGGCTREAAERIAGATLPVLSALVTKSLVRRAPAGRYTVHELVRQYAAARLAADAAEWRLTVDRHSLYYLDLLIRADAALRSSRHQEAVTELTAEMDNVRAAWGWTVAHGEISRACGVSVPLWHVLETRTWFAEGESLFRQAAKTLQARAAEGTTDEDVEVMNAHAGFFAFRLGKNEEAYAMLSRAAARLQSSADRRAAIYSLLYLGISCWQMGRFTQARQTLLDGLRKAREAHEPGYECFLAEFVGIVAHEQGEVEEARAWIEQALILARQVGDPVAITHILAYLCRTLVALGEGTEAERLLRESQALAREIGYRQPEAMALDTLGQLASARGSHAEARALFASSVQVFREIGATLPLSRALSHLGHNALARGDLSDARQSFMAALRIIHDDGLAALALDALAGLAAVDVQAAAGERALEIALQILDHPANKQEARDLVRQIRAELETTLTAEQIQAARQRARSQTFDDLVQQVLASV